MKALIIYFTGTKNTELLANLIKDRFTKELNFDVDLFSIDITSETISVKNYDLLIFSYPIYAFNMPSIFEDYVTKLDIKENQKCIIAKQSGEPISLNDSSSATLIDYIKKRKAILLNEYHFLFPYNIHFKYPDNFVKELMFYNEKLLDILIYEYKNNIQKEVKISLIYKANSFLFRIQRFGAFLNSYFYKVDYDKCIHCNRCMNDCPTKNITLKDNKFMFNNKCIMCMRCSFFCPKDAIKIGLLEGWKVNGAYNFEEIKNNNYIKGDYLKTHKSFFYNLFPKKIEKVNELHKKYFGD